MFAELRAGTTSALDARELSDDGIIDVFELISLECRLSPSSVVVVGNIKPRSGLALITGLAQQPWFRGVSHSGTVGHAASRSGTTCVRLFPRDLEAIAKLCCPSTGERRYQQVRSSVADLSQHLALQE